MKLRAPTASASSSATTTQRVALQSRSRGRLTNVFSRRGRGALSQSPSQRLTLCPGTGIGKDGFPLEEAFSSRKRQVAPLLYVRQVMTTDVICLHEDDTLRDALSLFLEKRVSGAPVIDSDGSLVGVLSMTDVIWVESKEAMNSLEFPFYPNLDEEDTSQVAREEEDNSMLDKTDVLLNMKVASRMSKNIISIEPEVLLNSAAALMIEKNINRLPVVDPSTKTDQNPGGMVLGIITRLDIMRCLAAVWL